MHDVFIRCQIGHIHRNGSALLHAKDRAWYLSVIGDRFDENAVANVDRAGLDA